jgi:hypothetical protein
MLGTFGRFIGGLALIASLGGQAAFAQNVSPTGNYTPDPDPSSIEGSGTNGTPSPDFNAELSMNSGASVGVMVASVGGSGIGITTVNCSIGTQTGPGAFTVMPGQFSLLPAPSGTTNLTVACSGATTSTRGLLRCDEDPKTGTTGTDVTVWFDVGCNTAFEPEFASTPAGGTPINLTATVGGNQTSTINVSNVGTTTLNVQGAGLTPPLTIAPSTQQAIGVAGNQDFTVTCAPTSVGVSSQTLSFTTNDPDDGEGTVTFPVTCTGTAAAAPQYNSVPAVGATIPISAQVGGSNTGTLTINNPGTQPLTAALSGLVNPPLSFTPAGPYNIAAGGNQVVTITCAPTTANTVVQTLSVDHNDSDGSPADPATYTIQCTGTNAPTPEYRSTPNAGGSVTINAAVGASNTGNVTVFNDGGATLTATATGLSGVLSSAPGGAQNIAPAANQVFTLTCTPTAVGTITQTLTITSNDGDEASNTYTVNCVGIAARFTSTPVAAGGTINLNAAQGGAAATFNLTIGNDPAAGQSLTYGAPAGLTAPLSIAPTTGGTLAAGATQPFTISCATTAAGVFTQTLTFTTNDPGLPSATFNVVCNIGGAGTPEFSSAPAAPGPINISTATGTNGTSIISVTNAGGADLTATASMAGGSDAEITVAPTTLQTIASGATTPFTVTCDATAPGTFTGTVNFATNDADEASVDFNVTCVVGGAAVYTSNPAPGATISLTATVGGNVTSNLAVTNTGGTGLDVTSAAGLSAPLSVAPTQQLGIAPNATFNFVITCAPTMANTQTQTLTVTHSAAGSPATYTVSCSGTTPPGGEFDPNVPNGNTITINTTINTTGSSVVTVLNSGTAVLSATASITAGGPAISVAPTALQTINQGLTRNFTVSCLSATPGVLNGTLNFVTDDPSELSVDYPVTCVVADVPPDIDVSPVPVTINALNNIFGPAGPPQSSTLTIANTAAVGGNTLNAIAAQLTPPLSISQTNFTLAPQANATFQVTCTPQVEVISFPPFFTFTFGIFGSFTQTLSFDTNDPDEDPANYTVTCNVQQIPAPEYNSTPAAGQTIILTTVVGSPVSANLQVQNSGSLADTVTPSGLSGILAVTPNAATPVGPSSSVDFTITCSPTVAGSVTQTLTIMSTDVSDNEAVNPYTVTCSAGTVPEPELNSIPASGTPIVLAGSPGTTLSSGVGITNSGVAPLRILGCNISGTGLTLTSTFPVDIDPADSGSVAFQCQVPPIGVPTVGSLSCTTNDTDEGTITFPLSCAGGLGPTEFIPATSAWSRTLLAVLLAMLGLAGLAWQRRRRVGSH